MTQRIQKSALNSYYQFIIKDITQEQTNGRETKGKL